MGEPAHLPKDERRRLQQLAKEVYDAVNEDREEPFVDPADLVLICIEYARLCGLVP